MFWSFTQSPESTWIKRILYILNPHGLQTLVTKMGVMDQRNCFNLRREYGTFCILHFIFFWLGITLVTCQFNTFGGNFVYFVTKGSIVGALKLVSQRSQLVNSLVIFVARKKPSRTIDPKLYYRATISFTINLLVCNTTIWFTINLLV